MFPGHFSIYDHFAASFVDFMQKFLAAKKHFLCVGFSQNADGRPALKKPYKQSETSALQNHLGPKLFLSSCFVPGPVLGHGYKKMNKTVFAIIELIHRMFRGSHEKGDSKQNMVYAVTGFYNTGFNRLQGAANSTWYCRERHHGKETFGPHLI